MYVPDTEALARLAAAAGVRLVSSDQEWDQRWPYSVPGLVWMIETDTCMTGRVAAPDNVAYDEHGCEFIYRQPRNEAELIAVLRAAWTDPFEAYRFDGLARWTRASATEWYETRQTLLGQLEKQLPYVDAETADGMRAARDHFRSDEFEVAKAQILDYLR